MLRPPRKERCVKRPIQDIEQMPVVRAFIDGNSEPPRKIPATRQRRRCISLAEEIEIPRDHDAFASRREVEERIMTGTVTQVVIDDAKQSCWHTRPQPRTDFDRLLR